MFLLLKYQKLLNFLVKNPKKKIVTFSLCFYMESPSYKAFTLTEMLQNLKISSKWNLNQTKIQEIGTFHLGLVLGFNSSLQTKVFTSTRSFIYAQFHAVAKYFGQLHQYQYNAMWHMKLIARTFSHGLKTLLEINSRACFQSVNPPQYLQQTYRYNQ